MDSSYEEVIGAIAGLAGGVLFVVLLVLLALCVLIIISGWKIMKKMGMPGWYCLIPYFGSYMETKAVYGVGWWFLITVASSIATFVGIGGILLAIIDLVVLVYGIKYDMDLALCFGKHWAFGLLLAFAPFVGMPMLAFGSAAYKGPRLGGPLNMSLS